MSVSPTLCLQAGGPFACFTRPEMKVERVSYDVMPPSAARGLLEAVLWKPAMCWEVERIEVLAPIRWTSVRRNEVGCTVPVGSVKSVMKNGHGLLGVYVEEQRQQRAGLLLRDVTYRIHARFHLTAHAGAADNVQKFIEMFTRRVEKGQCFHRPYLGCREFAADFGPPDDSPPEPLSRDLGWMLHDLDYSGAEPVPRFFQACLENGVLHVPAADSAEVRG